MRAGRPTLARRAATLAVVALVCALAAPAVAQAALPLPKAGGPGKPGPVKPAASLQELLRQATGGVVDTLANRIGLGTLGEIVVCPVGTKLAELAPPVPGVSEAAQAARFLACAMHFMDFEWRTTHPGKANRVTGNTAVTTTLVPTPLNMDSDPVPDMVASVYPLALNRYRLTFRRLPTAIGRPLPGTAELIITDPTRGTLPAGRIAVGIDSHGGWMPDVLSLTLTIKSFKYPLEGLEGPLGKLIENYQPPVGFKDPPRFEIDIDSPGQPVRAAVFADMFDEDKRRRRDSFMRMEVGMTPLPRNLNADLTFRKDQGIDASLRSTSRTLLDLDAQLEIQPPDGGEARRQHMTGEIDQLPSATRFSVDPTGAFSYAASHDIDRIDMTTTGLPEVGPARLERASVHVEGVPRRLETAVGEDGHALFAARDVRGALDGVDVAEIRGETADPPELPDGFGGSFLAFRQVGEELVAGARVEGVRLIDARPVPLDVTVDTDVLVDFEVDAAQDADADGAFEKTATARAESAINRVTARDVDDPGGERRFEVDTGSPLTAFDLDAALDNLPKGIRTVSLALRDLPELTRVKFPKSEDDVMAVDLLRRDAAGGLVKADGIGEIRASVNAGAPRGEIILRKTGQRVTGTDGLLAVLDDEGNVVRAGIRLRGLRGLSVGAVKPGAAPDVPPSARFGLDVAESQARPLALDYTQAGKRATGHIDRLPPDMVFELYPEIDTPAKYRAGKRISEIAISYADPEGIGEDVDAQRVDVQLFDLPTEMVFCMRDDGEKASCARPNRFDSRDDHKISLAYLSDAVDPPTTLRARLCEDALCSPGGTVLDASALVPRTLEFEAGASADTEEPEAPEFDCFDGYELNPFSSSFPWVYNDDFIGYNIHEIASCIGTWLADAIAGLLDSVQADAWFWFDTDGSQVTGTVDYVHPLPYPFSQPLRLNAVLPTLSAQNLFLHASMDGILSPAIASGGSLSCHAGGSFAISTEIDLGSFDVPLPPGISDLVDFWNGVASPEIPDPIEVDVPAVPLAFGLPFPC